MIHLCVAYTTLPNGVPGYQDDVHNKSSPQSNKCQNFWMVMAKIVTGVKDTSSEIDQLIW